MADEYVFRKDFWGDWKLVKKEDDSGFFFLILFLFVLLLTAAVLIAPFITALLGFKMNKRKRYWAGIFSVLSFSYFLVDINNKWLSALWFFGWESSGEFTNGILDENVLGFVYIINGLGLFIGLLFTIDALVLDKRIKRKTYAIILSSLIILSSIYWKINMMIIEREKWEIACQGNSYVSYTDYLKEYPEGKFQFEANESLSWLNAIDSDQIEKIRGFISNYPKGKFSERAKKWEENYMKDSVAWTSANRIYTEEVFKNYLINFPKGKYRKQADLAIESIIGFNGTKGSFKDLRNGKSYRWVKIGEQIWMAENIAIEGSITHTYNGVYYTWEAAQKICPSGWHLPTKDEFLILTNNTGKGNRLVSAKALSEKGHDKFNATLYKYFYSEKGWFEPSDYRPGSSTTAFWSASTSENDNEAIALNFTSYEYIDRDIDVATLSFNKMHYAFLVRCVKDKNESIEQISNTINDIDARDISAERTILNEPSSPNKIIEAGNIDVNENLKTTTKKNQRDPRAKDVANVFWDSKYTLFCILTDEPISPNSNGLYDIWYASNEEPYPHHKVLSSKDLTSLRFYKFKDFQSCKKWCDAKKNN